MHLLHTSTFRLVNVHSHDPPDYAILSHTWGSPDDEVSFEDIECDDPQRARSKPCFSKVEKACEKARERGLEFCWIDTCCIDKRSSAELQEAINSMFAWYRGAKICFAYLSDVDKQAAGESYLSQFENSRWFTRGWTLQELLAPADLELYTKDWQSIGYKRLLGPEISSVTGIETDTLLRSDFSSIPVATRMAWVSSRKTTRPEDIAYCLLGIFNVNMPLLYGEGDKAFLRLQEEILKRSEDDSIFAWIDPTYPDDLGHGLFADSPSQFGHFSKCHVQTKLVVQDYPTTEPFEATNQGIRIRAELYPIKLYPPLYMMPLSFKVYDIRLDNSGCFAIVLRKLRTKYFCRVNVARYGLIVPEYNRFWLPPTTIFVRGADFKYHAPPNSSSFIREIPLLREKNSPDSLVEILLSQFTRSMMITYETVGCIVTAESFHRSMGVLSLTLGKKVAGPDVLLTLSVRYDPQQSHQPIRLDVETSLSPPSREAGAQSMSLTTKYPKFLEVGEDVHVPRMVLYWVDEAETQFPPAFHMTFFRSAQGSALFPQELTTLDDGRLDQSITEGTETDDVNGKWFR